MSDNDRTDGSIPDTEPAPRNPGATVGGSRPAPAPYQQVNSDQRALQQASGQRRIVFGTLWLLAGVLITLITLANAAHGGTYVVAFGPILYGVYQIVTGIRMRGNGPVGQTNERL